MSCEICGRNSCTRSFHSLEMQEGFDRIINNPIYGRSMSYSDAKHKFEFDIEHYIFNEYEIDDFDSWIVDYHIKIIK